MNVQLRRMEERDLGRVATIQLATLPDDVWSKLGARFLRLFYNEAIRLVEIVLVAEHDGIVIGFVMGSTRPDRFFRSLLTRRVPTLLSAAAPVAVEKPRLCLRILGGLLSRSKAEPAAGAAVLMYMAVDPRWQQRRVGRALAESFIREAKRRGAARVRLKTDKLRNDGTNAFYRRLGFTLTGESLTLDRRPQNEYERKPASAAAGPGDLPDVAHDGARQRFR